MLTLTLALDAPSASAGYGGGYGGSSGNGIWALAWWAGNPEGPGPFTGPPAGAEAQCFWHDTGGSVTGLGTAISESGLPESFLTAPLSGGHPGLAGVLAWATALVKGASGGDHFDLVACPGPAGVPPNSGNVDSQFPRAHPPQGSPVWIWVFWDTVANPRPGALPPVIDEALSEVHLPSPQLSTSPSEVDGIVHSTVVNLPTWLWVNSSIWHSWVATATAGQIVATVWAEPSAVTWTAHWNFPLVTVDPEHGTTLAPELLSTRCAGPGTPYLSAQPGRRPDGACTAVFAESTLGTWQTLRATITWTVHWAVSNTAGIVGGEGLLTSATTSGTLPLRVMQVESIISSG
ncbi:MAG: hypothetical protein ACLPQS_09795 [Acidimicrobiales bacterium]